MRREIQYLLPPWSRVLLEKLTSFQLLKKFPTFYGTRKFITAFTSARHLFLSWASSIQSIPPHPTSWRSVLILSFHLCLGLPSGLFPSHFPTKTLYTPLFSPIRATWPAHLIFLGFFTRTILGEQYKSLSSSLCGFFHSPVTSSLLGPNILNTLFSNTLGPRSSPSMSATRTPTYKNYTIYFTFFAKKYESKGCKSGARIVVQFWEQSEYLFPICLITCVKCRSFSSRY